MKLFIFSLLIFSIALNCQATSQFQSLSEIRHHVDLYMHRNIPTEAGEHLTIEVGQIDPRLQLKACPKDHLLVFNPYPNSVAQTNTIGVQCQSEQANWKLYVSVQTKIEKMILTAKRNLGRGHRITGDDLSLKRQDIVPLKLGWFTHKKQVIGKICKQNISMNQAITPHLLAKEILVKRGEQVIIKADKGPIHISAPGKAMGKGSKGDVIRVENLKSKRMIQAEIIDKREVRVTI